MLVRSMRFATGAMIAGGLVALAQSARADVVLTVSAPGVQSSAVPGVTTETFDGFAAGQYSGLSTAVGTFSSNDMAIVNADMYGGAGGTGRYFAVGAESHYPTASLSLDAGGSYTYLGVWLSAVDLGNSISFFSGVNQVATFSGTDIEQAIGNNPQYFGNPNNGADVGERFAYLNFSGSSGTTFDRVVFTQGGGGGLELDNVSLGNVAAAPLPGSAYAGFALFGCLAAYKLRRIMKVVD